MAHLYKSVFIRFESQPQKSQPYVSVINMIFELLKGPWGPLKRT